MLNGLLLSVLTILGAIGPQTAFENIPGDTTIKEMVDAAGGITDIPTLTRILDNGNEATNKTMRITGEDGKIVLSDSSSLQSSDDDKTSLEIRGSGITTKNWDNEYDYPYSVSLKDGKILFDAMSTPMTMTPTFRRRIGDDYTTSAVQVDGADLDFNNPVYFVGSLNIFGTGLLNWDNIYNLTNNVDSRESLHQKVYQSVPFCRGEYQTFNDIPRDPSEFKDDSTGKRSPRYGDFIFVKDSKRVGVNDLEKIYDEYPDGRPWYDTKLKFFGTFGQYTWFSAALSQAGLKVYHKKYDIVPQYPGTVIVNSMWTSMASDGSSLYATCLDMNGWGYHHGYYKKSGLDYGSQFVFVSTPDGVRGGIKGVYYIGGRFVYFLTDRYGLYAYASKDTKEYEAVKGISVYEEFYDPDMSNAFPVNGNLFVFLVNDAYHQGEMYFITPASIITADPNILDFVGLDENPVDKGWESFAYGNGVYVGINSTSQNGHGIWHFTDAEADFDHATYVGFGVENHLISRVIYPGAKCTYGKGKFYICMNDNDGHGIILYSENGTDWKEAQDTSRYTFSDCSVMVDGNVCFATTDGKIYMATEDSDNGSCCLRYEGDLSWGMSGDNLGEDYPYSRSNWKFYYSTASGGGGGGSVDTNAVRDISREEANAAIAAAGLDYAMKTNEGGQVMIGNSDRLQFRTYNDDYFGISSDEHGTIKLNARVRGREEDIAFRSELSGLVPYMGATADVDIDNFKFYGSAFSAENGGSQYGAFNVTYSGILVGGFNGDSFTDGSESFYLPFAEIYDDMDSDHKIPTVSQIEDATNNLVPYTGATKGVNLNNQWLMNAHAVVGNGSELYLGSGGTSPGSGIFMEGGREIFKIYDLYLGGDPVIYNYNNQLYRYSSLHGSPSWGWWNEESLTNSIAYLVDIRDATNGLVSADNPAFSNAVLGVTLNLSTNVTEAIHQAARESLADLGLDPSTIKIGSGGGLGVLVVSLIIIALALHKRGFVKNDRIQITTANRDQYGIFSADDPDLPTYSLALTRTNRRTAVVSIGFPCKLNVAVRYELKSGSDPLDYLGEILGNVIVVNSPSVVPGDLTASLAVSGQDDSVASVVFTNPTELTSFAYVGEGTMVAKKIGGAV